MTTGGDASRVLLAVFYAFAGLVHLLRPDIFSPIVPAQVPFPHAVVIVTGICEIAGAAGLLTRRLRPAAGAALALYALCVWPANVRHALLAMEGAAWPATWWYHGPRLALQPLLIWWALHAGGWRKRPAKAR